MSYILTPEINNMQRAIYRMRTEGRFIPIAAYISQMEIIADDSVGTACTDCVRVIKYSPKYFDGLSVDLSISGMLHESLHRYLNFFPRFERWSKQYKGKYARGSLLRTFNIAQDFLINAMIRHDWHMPIHEDWLYDPKYWPTSEWTAEKIADELLAQPQTDSGSGDPEEQSSQGGAPDSDDQSDTTGDSDDTSDNSGDDGEGGGAGSADGDGGDGEGGDDKAMGEGDDIMLPEEYSGSIDNELSEDQVKDMEVSNREAVSNTMRMSKGAKGIGNTPTGSDPFSSTAESSAYEVGFDFAAELKQFANVASKTGGYTWYRPNRRMKTNQGLSLPGKAGKTIGTAVFCIDSSGSTSGAEVRFFIDEIVHALQTVDYKRAVIVWCSDDVPSNGIQEFTKEEVTAKGSRIFDGVIRRAGGGTHFYPAFMKIAELYPDVRCISYLTDGGVGDYEIPQVLNAMTEGRIRQVPVLWLCTEVDWSWGRQFAKNVKEHNVGRVVPLPKIPYDYS